MHWYWSQYVDVIDLNGEHLIFIQLEDDAAYFPGAPDAMFGTVSDCSYDLWLNLSCFFSSSYSPLQI